MADRRATERQYHRDQIADWSAQGRTLRWIAAELHISRETVRRDLAVLDRLWAVPVLERSVRKNLAAADQVLAAAWDGYEKSCGEKLGGDPNFLRAALGAIERRCKLLGLHRVDVQLALTDARRTAEDDDDFDWAEYDRRWHVERLGAHGEPDVLAPDGAR
jgi:hypothetical protein